MLEAKIYLDNTRRKFADQTFRVLYYLVNGMKEDSTSYRRLLLGRKGVGKTTLLKKMQECANEIFKGSLITIYYACEEDKFELPFKLITERIGSRETNSIDELEEELIKKNKFIFLVFDELQNVYTSHLRTISKKAICQLSKIGGSSRGRIHCIISGSSSDLRKLCFCKFKERKLKLYPSYENIDLNSTKFSPRWIFPFLDSNDFKNLAIHFEKKYKEYEQTNKTNDLDWQYNLAKMYLVTGGSPRLLDDYITSKSCDSYAVTERNIEANKKLKKILECILNITRDIDDSYSALDDLFLKQ